MTMRKMRALVLRAPGINCDRETAHACRLAGFEVEQLHINSLLQAPERLLDFDFLVLSGGFSYGDDLGAGTLLAKNLTVHLGRQLRQFIDEGRPVLGICNGFQVLVRAGLLPNNADETSPLLTASLTDNASAQFECRWVRLGVQNSTCIFTQNMAHTIELPVAHGEGQFVLADTAQLTVLQAHGQVPLEYGDGSDNVAYPDNPNGSIGNIAGVCNAQGNVLGLMPHPERYVSAMQHPQRRGTPHGQGDGLSLFKNAYAYAQKLAGTPKNGTPKQGTHEDTVQTGFVSRAVLRSNRTDTCVFYGDEDILCGKRCEYFRRGDREKVDEGSSKYCARARGAGRYGGIRGGAGCTASATNAPSRACCLH